MHGVVVEFSASPVSQQCAGIHDAKANDVGETVVDTVSVQQEGFLQPYQLFEPSLRILGNCTSSVLYCRMTPSYERTSACIPRKEYSGNVSV